MNLADVLARNAAFTPGTAALRFEGRTLTYSGLSRRIEAAAALLAGEHGVRRGDRVAVLAHNHPDTLVLLHACARLGAMLLPLNWRLAAPEIEFILHHAEPAVLVLDDPPASLADRRSGRRVIALRQLGAALDPVDDDPGGVASAGRLSDPVLLVYTSGTTGRPKGAVLTQAALLWNAAMSGHMHGLTADDHVLAVLPFFHVGGLNIQTLPALQVGATVTIHPRFAPDATLAAIAADRPTLTVLVPATMAAVAAESGFATADLSGLRAVTTGSTYVPQAAIDSWEGRGVPVLQVYGATETGPIAIYTRHVGERSRPGSTGWPGVFCEAKVVGAGDREMPAGRAGEIWVRGPAVFSGYWRDQAASAEALVDGWFRTGDIAPRDPDGAFTVHDRKGNMIISGGENIYPAEIERVLLTHEAVAEAAVIGRADSRWGEVPVAVIVPRTGRDCRSEALAAHLAAELARFKLPAAYVFVETLPRNALGKVQHRALRASLEAATSG